MSATRINIAEILLKTKNVSDIDLYFADFLCRMSSPEDPDLYFIAACVSRFSREGHICFDLKSNLISEIADSNLTGYLEENPEKLAERLLSTGAVGNPGEFKPLIIDAHKKVYLHRYWHYQENVAKLILDRINQKDFFLDLETASKKLSLLFSAEEDSSGFERISASLAALLKRFIVISGGPGTGKTTFALKIALLLHALKDPAKKNLRIIFAAPTGKAAARLNDAVNASRQNIDVKDSDLLFEHMEALTIHRLLKNIPGTPFFFYNAGNKLPVDLLIIDESSMIDVAMMSKLLEALHEDTRLILLGDKDQLASVEAGAMLGDICEAAVSDSFSRDFTTKLKEITGIKVDSPAEYEHRAPLTDCVIQFTKNFRFSEKSGIGIISTLIKEGKLSALQKFIEQKEFDDVVWIEDEEESKLREYALGRWNEIFSKVLSAGSNAEKFRIFNEFRILTAHRIGPTGSLSINQIIESEFKRKNRISPQILWYKGKPVLITANDYDLQLFNGDSGIVLEDKESKTLKVFFEKPGNNFKMIDPYLLPEYETFFSMTVHKSQGSEFEHILLVLPEKDSPVLSRELLYTAITRAKNKVEIWGKRELFLKAAGRRVERTSGLTEMLRE